VTRRCTTLGPRFVGDPVDVITGENRGIATDFSLHGTVYTFHWNRHYSSARANEDRGNGRGHRHVLDWALHADLDGLTLRGPEDPVAFPGLWEDGAEAIRDGWRLERVSETVFRARRSGEAVHEFVRDAPGANEARLSRILRDDGEQTQLEYQALREGHRLVAVRDSEGWVLRLEWRRDHIAAVHAHGTFGVLTVARYEYDDAGHLLTVWDAREHAFAWRYDEFHRVVRRADQRGNAYVFRYDGRGRCVRAAGEDGYDAVSFVYLPDVCETRVEHESDGGRWIYRYEPSGNLLEIEAPYGGKRQFLYDEEGRQTGEVDLQGDLWTLVRDDAGKVTGKRDPLGYLRDANEDPIDPEVNPFLEEYAACPLTQEQGELLGTDFELPKDTVFAAVVPEALREVLWTQGEAGVVSEVRDAEGLLLRKERRFADGRVLTRSYAYDLAGNLVRLRDFDGGEWRFEIAAWNHMVGYRAPTGGEFRIARSKTHAIVRFEDPGGTVTEYDWDQCGRLVGVHRHGALRERYVHDAAGRFVELRNGAGERLVAYERGPLDALMARRTRDGVEERFERDERGRIVEATSSAPWSSPCTVVMEHDEWFHRLRDERDGAGVRHEYRLGRLAKTEVRVAGRVCTIGYVRVDRDTLRIEDPTGGVHHVRRVGPGVVVREAANGTIELSQYDERGLCLARATTGSTGVWRRRFVLSGEGDLLVRQDDRRGTTWHEYDAGHRLVASRGEGVPVERCTYDLANNLRSKPGLSEGHREDAVGPYGKVEHGAEVALGRGNRLLGANGDRFEYDDRHHMVRRSGAWGSLRYVRDDLGRLRRIERAGSAEARAQVVWEAEYDALGRRIRKRVHGVEGVERWEFFWDCDRLAAEQLPDGRLRVYVYVDAAALVPMLAVEYASAEAEAADGAVYLLQTDHRGAVERVEDSGGQVVWEAVVQPFGEASVLTGRGFHQPFRLVGQYHDEETGLSVTRFRYWSSELGRFLESDPIGLGGGTNLYAWPGCPLVDGDPLGLGEKKKKQCKKCKGHGECDACKPKKTEADKLLNKEEVSGSDAQGPAAKERESKASDLTILKPGTKEWNDAVSDLQSLKKGKRNYSTETAADARQLLKEGRGNMDRRKQYRPDKYKKGYETHNSKNARELDAGNDLQHIKWKDGKSGGHIYYSKPN
jgi:RHS repeat-associated protein